MAVDAGTSNQRLATLAALASSANPAGERNGALPLVIASTSAVLRQTLPPEAMLPGTGETPDSNVWKVGQRVRLNQLLTRWVDLGYRNEPLVEVPGTFSHRGGIIDVYPSHSELPFRIELWDDEIDTIRLFEPRTQRSVRSVDEVSIIPAREQLPNLADRHRVNDLIGRMDFSKCDPEVRERIEDELTVLFAAPNIETLAFYNGLLNQTNLLDYLSKDALVVLERGAQVAAEAEDQEERFVRMRTSREERGELPRNFPSPYLSWREFAAGLEKRPRANLESLSSDDGDALFHPATPYYGRLEQLTSDIRRYQGEGRAVVAVTQHARRLVEILEQDNIGVSESDGMDEPPLGGHAYVVAGSLREGWTLESLPASAQDTNGRKNWSLTLLTDGELFGTAKERRYRRPRRSEGGPEVILSELVPGSYVVHIDHGVARFAGTTSMGDQGEEEKEYLVLEYAETDKLYVPTDHLDRVSAYVGPQDRQPNLTRLGSAEWARVKERVKGDTLELARELLQLQAARQAATGHEFSPDTTWQQELEDSFPYEETPDQSRAIYEVKGDMEQLKPMDRLICGDVGYGKTEVALRAAFKTVNEGMQVGVLVPTTVLAQQHYVTFSERLSPFPVRVEVLSRFRTPKEQQEVVEGIKTGAVDIVIGTHRLLQKDVEFKQLGLAVVDEEQRFGVAHKERLKQLRREVDVLTLSATPIPRTLNQALSGIRDLSTMDTPPESRLPIKTFVAEHSDDLIKEAILRELERNGQVFFLHNRVRTIGRVALELADLVPEARIAVGHGQMPESELEEVMLSFLAGEADVLVCTTIIESGLDIPNVNTLIVDRADRFGLSQLYQLRGRVGRGDHRAYAYLLLPRGRRITETAEKRIQAILEASDLGSGFRIAMRDLEIRGAGNLLGAAQSGNIHAVGLDLYSQLLKEAVRELQEADAQGRQTGGQAPAAQAPAANELPRVELPLPARIPDSYIPHTPVRLAVYQRLAKISDRGEVPRLRDELRDRFGPLPQEVENLLVVTDLRAMAGSLGILSIIKGEDSIVLALDGPVGGARVPLQRALGPSANVGNQQIQIPTRRLGEQWLSRLTSMLGRFQAFRDSLQAMAREAAQAGD
ncbi:MAG: transcription-repair coupling factor [SAR202 cluster bacterium Io17-Chloro-G9]|nr:MAG: transcription-repair coupling factor [SAR202 cluster bacterium Io17-Chloro-G9]